MIQEKELRRIAEARLKDATALLNAKRYDGATYLCGYAIELTLKARICKTLKWLEFPSANNEFKNYQSFKVHNLDVLLHLSGKEDLIKTKFFAEWSAVAAWDPTSRYQSVGTVRKADAELMIAATKALLGSLK
ncbi:HEPN domain-containing protein [Trichlorobacter lovleyi]|uniref:HEPN domain-containing protein n=1 Tax=Trichlorobacter lovleyi TaxID=313985 RepID=UPI0023F1B86A|nr:HEPN domain-containing protein [Trichlorobacter lovleyi]